MDDKTDYGLHPARGLCVLGTHGLYEHADYTHNTHTQAHQISCNYIQHNAGNARPQTQKAEARVAGVDRATQDPPTATLRVYEDAIGRERTTLEDDMRSAAKIVHTQIVHTQTVHTHTNCTRRVTTALSTKNITQFIEEYLFEKQP